MRFYRSTIIGMVHRCNNKRCSGNQVQRVLKTSISLVVERYYE